jgi:hypothetical protein
LLYFRNGDDQLEFPANGAPHLLSGAKQTSRGLAGMSLIDSKRT